MAELFSRGTLLLICAAAFTPASAQEPAAPGPVTERQILDAWKERQDRIRSGKFEWRETFTLDTSGLEVAIPDPELQRRIREQKPTTTEILTTYSFDGVRGRTREREKTADGLRDDISVSDGKTGKGLMRRPKVQFPNQGSIAYHAVPNRSDSRYHALLLALRPTGSDPQSFGVSGLRLTGQTDVIDGVECLKAEVSADKRGPRLAWIDPGRGFSVVRVQSEQRGQLTSQIDIEYSPDKLVGWLPSKWRYIRFTSGRMTHARSAEVTSYTLNPKLPAGEFDLEFPPGTHLSDMREGGIGKNVIVEAGGRTSKPVSRPASVGRPEPVADGGSSGWPASLLIAGSAAAVLLAAAAIYRRNLKA